MLKGMNETRQMNKVLVVTDINHEFQQCLPELLNLEASKLLVLSSVGAAITQPYGCLVRNIILEIYQQNVEQIYIIAPKEQTSPKFNQSILLDKFEKDGIDQGLVQALDYSRVVNEDILSWLQGKETDVEITLKQSLDLLQKHPLIPPRVKVVAYTANSETDCLTEVELESTEKDIC
jgi:carbonic anhydrase